MATSGVITGIVTARDLIKMSLELIGVSDNHEDAASYDMAMRHLNWMLKGWQTDGCNLWREGLQTITWTANAQSMTMAPNVIDIQSARYVQSATYERELARWERGDYNALPNKAAQGLPTIYSFQKQTGAAKMYVWPVPTTSTTIKVVTARVIEDVTELSQNLDIPQEYTDTAVYCLADRLCEPFSVTQSQPNVTIEVKRKAATKYQNMLNADRPASVFFKQWGAPY